MRMSKRRCQKHHTLPTAASRSFLSGPHIKNCSAFLTEVPCTRTCWAVVGLSRRLTLAARKRMRERGRRDVGGIGGRVRDWGAAV